MNPNDIKQIIRQEIKNMLGSYDQIPLEVQNAFERRISVGQLEVSSKGVDTEDQAVNEGGAGTYDVLTDPDGFLEVKIDGTTYYIPYYG